MSRIRLRKIWGDLWANEMRSFLAVLAIAIGVFGVGSILSTYAILSREINANYLGTTPASVKLFVEEADRELASAIESLPDVGATALRRTIRARIQLDSEDWLPFKLLVIDDFNSMPVSSFTSESGEWPPADGEILLERSSVSIKQTALGDQIMLEIPNGEAATLTISGIVHDPAQAPGWQDGIDYGYITVGTLAQLGEAETFNELHVLVAENQLDEAYINTVAPTLRKFVEEQGYAVSAVSVPTPGVHPHSDQMESLLFLLQAFGALTLLLSGVLVATIIAALIKQQTKQFGAMKAIGGRTTQIANIYFGMVLLFGLSALILGIPLSISAGRGYAEFTATLLNFEIMDDAIPLWVFLVQSAVGLTVPLLSAAIPISQISRITVSEAIRNVDVSSTTYGTNLLDRMVANLAGFSRPMRLALRNTFRRRLRLALIVTILAIGGATFMSSLNVNQSWLQTIDVAFRARLYDFKVDFAQPYPTAQVEETLLALPDVVAVESWNSAIAVQEFPDGSDGLRFHLSAVPPTTQMIDYPLIEGRWLQPDDTNALVINHEMFFDDHIDIHVGDSVILRINGQPEAWMVIGVVREIGAPRRGLGLPASAYVSLDAFNQITGMVDSTVTVRVVTTEHSAEAHTTTQRSLDKELAAAGLRVADLQASSTRRQILEDHLVVILAFLLAMATLIAAVGSLALASVISINVLERSREIGMMRAIGGSSRTILQIILVEGVMIGLLSWFAAALLARPLSRVIGNLAGWLFIRSELVNVFSVSTLLIWLGLIVIISLVASIYPAWNATRLSVREVLSYE